MCYASSTTCDEGPEIERFRTALGITKIGRVQDCNVLCVGRDGSELTMTKNIVLAVLKGAVTTGSTTVNGRAKHVAWIDIRLRDPQTGRPQQHIIHRMEKTTLP